MTALLDAAEEAQNGVKIISGEDSLQTAGSQKREASKLTTTSDVACPLVAENGEMKSERESSENLGLHLRAGAEGGASALASREDTEVMMRPMVVLKKTQ